jgi:hypothetical protein
LTIYWLNSKSSFSGLKSALATFTALSARTAGFSGTAEGAELCKFVNDQELVNGSMLVNIQARLDDILAVSQPYLAKPSRPPGNAELLLHLFLSPASSESLVGDLDERFVKLERRLGRRCASIWYWKQIATSIWPLCRDSLRRVGSSAAAGIFSVALRVIGLGSVADQWKRALKRSSRGGRIR